MEKYLTIPTEDNYLIYGVLNEPIKSAKDLIIFVHGFTGHSNEHFYHNSASFFPNQGYATFRFNFYSGEKQSRSMIDSTMETHIADLKCVHDFFKNKYTNLFLVGHSIGGQIIVRSELSVKAQVLWDPARDLIFDELEFNKKLGAYLLDWGVTYIVSKMMYDSFMKQSPIEEIRDRILVPTKIIAAEKGGSSEAMNYFGENISDTKVFIEIQGANHAFDQLGKDQELFSETLSWFEKYK